ncbi:MAG TPA: class I SAM-dependent methyltransferase, partial [Polyangiaceae bacterium]|nr:class I SAM-dependent methyltransferase [Polyangiaceae bacterium]
PESRASLSGVSAKTIPVTDAIWQYLMDATVREPAILGKLRDETSRMPSGGMQISPEQGQFMALLVELIGARRAIEVGVFTGYSSLRVALALPPDGRIVACDVSEEYTNVARRYWREAGVDGKIELRLGPALGTLDALAAEGQKESFDFAFIDADKANYSGYYERCLSLLRPGGLVAVDNTLWSGAVADPQKQDPDTRAIRELNAKVAGDPRVSSSLVPIGDGLLLARKR